jgi:membrane-bound metal-dependent hydrolase YbcI (DUF457 family)
MGPAHTASGLAAGALTLPLAAAHGVDTALWQLAWVAAWGGAAYLPDLDQKGSTAGSLWGPLTQTVAGVIGRAAGGHRKGTHDLLVAPLAFGLLAVAAAQARWSALLLLAVVVGLAFHGLVQRRLPRTAGPLVNLAVSAAGAFLLASHGHQSVAWLPWAVAGGVLVHIAGDWLTTDGIPVPLTTWVGRRRSFGLRAFDAGHGPEGLLRVAVFPALTLLGLWWHTGLGTLPRLLLDTAGRVTT